jgi:hypothetical protein
LRENYNLISQELIIFAASKQTIKKIGNYGKNMEMVRQERQDYPCPAKTNWS